MANWIKIVFGVFLIVQGSNAVFCQYKSIDFEISTSPYFDDRLASLPSDRNSRISGIAQFGIGYSTEIGKQFVLSPKVAYGIGGESSNIQLSSSPNALPDSIRYDIRRTAKFLKLGIAASYWFNKPGNGAYAEAEIQNSVPISAVSREKFQIGSQTPQEQTLDYKDELKSSVPSFRLGIGYNLQIKRVVLFARVSFEFRASTYFTTTDNYTWANRSVGFGFRYTLQTHNEQSD